MNKRINELRSALKLSAEKFGSRVGVTRSAISRIENGVVNVTDQMFHSICREFNVREEWLRDGIEPMFNDSPTFSLDEFAAANELTNTELRVVRGLMELKPELRNAICDVFKNAFLEEGSIYSNAPDNPEELERLSSPINDDNVDSNIS